MYKLLILQSTVEPDVLKGISAANTVFAMAVSGTVVAGVLALFKKILHGFCRGNIIEYFYGESFVKKDLCCSRSALEVGDWKIRNISDMKINLIDR